MAHASKKKHKKHEEEEHENHERWLVTYADMLTVLMALFIVMFAISSVNRQKFDALAAGLANGFGGPPAVISGGRGVMDKDGIDDPSLNLMTAVKPPSDGSLKQALQSEKDRENLLAKQAAVTEAKRLEGVKAKLQDALNKKGLPEAAKFRIDERGLVVTIVTDKVLFAPDRAELQAGGQAVLTAVGPVLKATPNGLLVEGHTNTVPVAPKYFASEWELSSTRASSVARYLIKTQGVPAKRFTVVGYADQRPLYGPENPRANDLNRRVELIVQTSLPPATAGLLAAEAKKLESVGKST